MDAETVRLGREIVVKHGSKLADSPSKEIQGHRSRKVRGIKQVGECGDSYPLPSRFTEIAQLVEQRIVTPRVAGSIPALCARIRWTSKP